MYGNHLDAPQTLQARRKGTHDKPSRPNKTPTTRRGERRGHTANLPGPRPYQISGTGIGGTYDKPLGQSLAPHNTSTESNYTYIYIYVYQSSRLPKPYKHEERGHTQTSHEGTKGEEIRQTSRPLQNHRNTKRGDTREIFRAINTLIATAEANDI